MVDYFKKGSRMTYSLLVIIYTYIGHNRIPFDPKIDWDLT